ncbi:MAG: hypothetical protein QM770_11060 [Tepidisphaeraceae bacterium]
MDVYWSTIYPPEVYADYHMLYKEPDLVFKSVLPERDDSNPGDFFACPGFQHLLENTFAARCTVTGDVALRADGIAPLNDKSNVPAQLFQYWPNSRKQYRVVNFDHRLLFFCEEPLEMSTSPAFLHRTDFQSKLMYIPAGYDISKWLRPLQGTFEIPADTKELHFREGDPLYYVKFHTEEKIRLRRFKPNAEIHGVAHGCVHYKLFRPQQSLGRVYDAFVGSKLPKHVIDQIKANLLD